MTFFNPFAIENRYRDDEPEVEYITWDELVERDCENAREALDSLDAREPDE